MGFEYDLKNCTMDQFTDDWEYANRVHRSGMNSFAPAIVGCAITGGNHGKEANPNLPETVDEQVRSAKEAVAAGAVMLHIHRRDPKNTSVRAEDPELYREVNIKIREACPDVIINNTIGCGCSVNMDTQTRMAPMMVALDACPEIGSLDASAYTSYVKLPARPGVREQAGFKQIVYSITQPEVENACKLFAERGIKPEFELFAISDYYYITRLLEDGYKDPAGGPLWVNFVFTGGSNWPNPGFVNEVVKKCPAGCILQISGTGAQQWPVLAQALVHGAHVRVGMEDNVYYAKGVKAESNGQLVEKIVRMARDLDRRVATVEEARAMLGLGAPRKW